METIWSKRSYIFFNFCEVNETVTKNYYAEDVLKKSSRRVEDQQILAGVCFFC